MQVAPEVIEVEQLAESAGVSITPLLEREGIAPSTWWRWRNDGVEPRVSTLRRVRHAVQREIEAQAAS